VDDRQIVNGILKRIKYGVKWKDIPREYGAMSTCFTRYKEWQQQGVWERIWKKLNTEKSCPDFHAPKI
jgi:transposase